MDLTGLTNFTAVVFSPCCLMSHDCQHVLFGLESLTDRHTVLSLLLVDCQFLAVPIYNDLH